MRNASAVCLVLLVTVLLCSVRADDGPCVVCHQESAPGIIDDWRASRHHVAGIGCADCHGNDHTTAEDAARVATITAHTCKRCHEEKYAQYAKGKHAMAWGAYEVLPTTHMLPMALGGPGTQMCGSCHKIGLKGSAKIEALKAEGSMFGHASCDACHTRHLFSVNEARQPQACQTCHMGFDHPQWEMWSSSKHGVRYLLKQSGVLPDSVAAPTCQTCHMREGNHEVRTPWGHLAIRLPLPEDERWRKDQVTVMQALGLLDPEGNPTARLKVKVKAGDMARLTEEAFNKERGELRAVCNQCHSKNFSQAELAKGDEMVRQADRLLAEAIREIAALYRDGVLPRPEGYAYDFPDLLTVHNEARPIELQLFEMHLIHRMVAIQGTFHASPEYALSHGWRGMVRSLAEIRQMAQRLRAEAVQRE